MKCFLLFYLCSQFRGKQLSDRAREACLNCVWGLNDVFLVFIAQLFVRFLRAVKIVSVKRQLAFFLALYCCVVSSFWSPSFSSLFSFSYSAYAEEIVPQLTRRGLDELSILSPPKRSKKSKRDKTDIVFDIYKDREDLMWDRYETFLEKKERRGAERPLLEVFSGADATENQVGLYAGGVTGALDDHLNLKGLRLRAVYGESWYEYHSSREIDGAYVDVAFQGTSQFYEAMIGYEFRALASIFKIYGGVMAEENDIDPRDTNNRLQGQKIGAKLLLEAWHDFGKGHWFSGYASHSSASGYYVAHGRYGLPASYFIDVGLEFGAFGNDEFDALRVGGFSRFKMGDGEWTLSAGLSGDYDEPDAFYATMQYFTKFYLSDILVNRSF